MMMVRWCPLLLLLLLFALSQKCVVRCDDPLLISDIVANFELGHSYYHHYKPYAHAVADYRCKKGNLFGGRRRQQLTVYPPPDNWWPPAQLLSVESKQEQDFVTGLALYYGTYLTTDPNITVWLGLKPCDPDDFFWADGTKAEFRNFLPNQPNNISDDANGLCAFDGDDEEAKEEEACFVWHIKTDQMGGWRKNCCEQKRPVICKEKIRTSEGCPQIHYGGMQGELHSAAYPEPSPPDMRCYYVIRVPERHQIELTFNNVSGNDAQWDGSHMYVYEGATDHGPQIYPSRSLHLSDSKSKPYTGAIYESKSNVVSVVFKTNKNLLLEAKNLSWSASYQAVPEDVTLYRGVGGNITTPNYPSQYPIPCMEMEAMRIRGPPGHRIRVTIHDFDTYQQQQEDIVKNDTVVVGYSIPTLDARYRTQNHTLRIVEGPYMTGAEWELPKHWGRPMVQPAEGLSGQLINVPLVLETLSSNQVSLFFSTRFVVKSGAKQHRGFSIQWEAIPSATEPRTFE